MQVPSGRHLFLLAILFVLFSSGTCHKCYFCAGVDVPEAHEKQKPILGLPLTPACVFVDPDNNNLPTLECPGDCVKGVVFSQGVTLVMRGCTEPPQCKDGTGECHHCTGELCNSSTNVVPSLTISILSLAFIKWRL